MDTRRRLPGECNEERVRLMTQFLIEEGTESSKARALAIKLWYGLYEVYGPGQFYMGDPAYFNRQFEKSRQS